MEEKFSIEQSLLKEGIVSKEQLQTLKIEQQRSSISLVEAIRRLKFVQEDTLIDFLAEKLHLLKFEANDFAPSKELFALLTADFAWKEKVVPLLRITMNWR